MYVLLLLFAALLLFYLFYKRGNKRSNKRSDKQNNKQVEPFADTNAATNQLSPDFLQLQNAFYPLMNTFQETYMKAVVTAMSMETDIQPASSPTATDKPKPVAPSEQELNTFITTKLSPKLGGSLPPILATLSALDASADPVETMAYYKKITKQPIKAYKTALNWMNGQMEEALQKLGQALAGGRGASGFQDFSEINAFRKDFVYNVGLPEGLKDFKGLKDFMARKAAWEGFDGSSQCQELLKCQEENDAAQSKKAEERVKLFMKQFAEDQELKALLEKNKRLVEESKKVQNQAQSGELLGKMNFPKEPSTSYTLPEGSNKLKDMEKNDPNKYKEYQKSQGQLMGLKTMIDQINGSLR
jgi:hypothetical protein